MTSVVIAAHNEAAVIGRCLEAMLAGAAPTEFDITVVANGCADDTAAVAARHGVRVVELATASKPAALNAGDAVAVGFPRIYLDADIVLTTAALRAIADAVRQPATAAAVPRRELDLAGRPLPVRGFFAINRHLPAFQEGLFGRGVIALSAEGRGRFNHFPDLVADDLYLDSLFTSAEKGHVNAVTAKVATPYRTRDLYRRLVRVRAGNAALRAAATGNVRTSSRLSWLRDVALPRPWLLPAAGCYIALTVAATVGARRAARRGDVGVANWGRDESTRD